ncbi:MAG: hypothetical protein HYZ29_07815 [Myxococcales bacterium]|nr:hypothetical protein [Myxococcales bacterium]
MRLVGLTLAFLIVACGDSGGGSGAASGGATSSGGASPGGASSGGTSSGGTSSGGTSSGGTSSGGSAGAAGSGGIASGGSPSGGAAGAGGSAAAGGSAGDAGAVPLPGFGKLLGDCGPLDATEILSPSPFSFQNSLDFGGAAFEYNALSTGGKKIFDAGNLGGSSIHSEIFSYEVLYRCELATLLKTEAEVKYTDTGGKKTDLLVQIDGYKLGVSVTRAYAYPPGTPYAESVAKALLEKKLGDILLSSKNVVPADAWKKQILHILAYDTQHRDALAKVYPQVSPTTRADTIVMVTVTEGNDGFVY